MSRNDHAGRAAELPDYPLRSVGPVREPPRQRTIVVRHRNAWPGLAVLALCLVVIAAVLLGHEALRRADVRAQEAAAALSGMERKVQELESSLAFDSRRRRLLLGMRDHIMTVNPRVGLADAYRYAELALLASERYPAVDPLLLVAIGTVESRYDPAAVSRADARGLYQIWPSTGRLLLRGLGWEYDEAALHDPEKNTAAAALYLDILFSAYGDPQLVLAEYNGGPLNAGYFRAGVGALAQETRDYVPRVLELYGRLKAKFGDDSGPPPEWMHRDPQRAGKTLAGAARRPPPR